MINMMSSMHRYHSHLALFTGAQSWRNRKGPPQTVSTNLGACNCPKCLDRCLKSSYNENEGDEPKNQLLKNNLTP